MIYGNALMPGGSGKAGATLTVFAPLGSVITISKDGESYSSTLLPAVFKGLSSGTWTRTATLNGQTSEKLIQIVADYADTVEYFAATINVTFPAGSAVECRQGDYVISTTNTSGSHIFTVPNSGTWTVSCTDGASSDSQNVEITANGQSVSVTLIYWDGSLYDNGNEFESITGGWGGYPFTYGGQTYSSPTVSKNATNIQLSVSNNGGAASFANKLNLDGFSTLNINFISNNFGANRLSLYLASEREQNPIATIDVGGKTGVVSLSFDPSTLGGDVYIGLGGYAAVGISYSAVFDRMWLS